MMKNKSRGAVAFRDYLNDEEETELSELIELCNKHDGTGYGFPEDADCYGLLYIEGRLCAAMALFGMGASSSGLDVDEIAAWTDPLYRGNGLFTRLYEELCDTYETAAVKRFSIYSNEAAHAVLSRIGAVHTYDECMMRLELFSEDDIYRPGDLSEEAWSIKDELVIEDGVCDCRYGSASFKIYGETAYIYAVFIYDSYRSKGYGFRLMYTLLEHLRAMGLKECFLEVSSENLPAVGLYSKLGFKIKERLKYYEKICNH